MRDRTTADPSTAPDELTELVAKVMWETDCLRWGENKCGDVPRWNTEGTGYIAMAREAIAIVRQWDAGK